MLLLLIPCWWGSSWATEYESVRALGAKCRGMDDILRSP